MSSLMRVALSRRCPKCNQTLYIDVKDHTVSCNKCGFIEPCHLKGLEPSIKNCRSCIYRKGFKQKRAKNQKVLRTILLMKAKLNSVGLKLHLPKMVKPELIEEKKWKVICTQAWNFKKRTVSYNPFTERITEEEEEDLDEEIEIQYSDEDAEED